MIKRNPKILGRELALFLEEKRLSQDSFVREFNASKQEVTISQPWLSRMLKGGIQKTTARVRGVLGYANIPIYSSDRIGSPDGRELIDQAVADVWDGSSDDAVVLADILRACRGLRARQ